MTLVDINVQLWRETDFKDDYDFIARCARVCYASDRTSNSKEMVDRLIKDKHLSMLRHKSIYMKIPYNEYAHNKFIKFALVNNPFCKFVIDSKCEFVCVSTNWQYYSESYLLNLGQYCISTLTAFNDKTFYDEELLRYTFCIETGIDITRELNRTSPNNIAEQSTRYVDFIKKLGIRISKPHWFDGLGWFKKFVAKCMFKTTEINYNIARKFLGLKPQDARAFLCLKTNSKVIYTYTLKEWRHIIDLRYFGTTGNPHPDAKATIEKVKQILEEEEGYTF